MIYYTLNCKPENPTRGGTTEGREADEALVELRAETGAPLEREIRSIARLETFKDPQFNDFCRKYQVTDNAKEALINLLHVLRQRGSLTLEGPGGSLEVDLMACYTLRDPTRNRPVTEEDMLEHQVRVKPWVDLRADSGIGESLVEKIRNIARRKPFENPRTHQFCQQYQVTDQKALQNLLGALEDKDLKLEDPDAGKVWDVKKIGKK